MKLMNLFRRKEVSDVMRDMRYEAERMAIEHEAAGEHHMALAAMYRERIARLTQQQLIGGAA